MPSYDPEFGIDDYYGNYPAHMEDKYNDYVDEVSVHHIAEYMDYKDDGGTLEIHDWVVEQGYARDIRSFVEDNL